MNQRLRESKGRFVAQGKSAKKAASDIQGLTGAVKGFVTAAALAGAAKFVFANTAELEKQTRSLQVLTGSLDTAKGIISELQDFGAVTPFTSTELIDTAKRLKAFGVETESLVDITKRLGDVAGATGADLGGITTAFGQIQAKGKLQTEELLQLQERGVDLAGVLKKEYNLTGEEFSKALQKGQISAEAAEFALKKLTDTGGMYADGAISQSDTLSGKLSTLVDNVQRIAQALGALLAPMLKKVFDLTNNALTQINDLMFAMTNPGEASARKAIQGGRHPFHVQGAAELFEGTGVGGRGLKGMQEASTQLAKMGGNRRDILLRLMQDRLAEMDAENLPKVDTTLPTLPPLTAGTTPGTGSKKTLRERKDLTAEMNALLEKQQQLAHSTDEIAKSRLVKEIEYQRIIEAQMLPLEEQRALRDAEIQHEKNIARIMGEKLKKITESNEVRLDGIKNVFKNVFDEGQKIDDALEQQKEKMRSLYKSIGDSIQSGIVDSLMAAVDGTKSLADIAKGVLKDIGKTLLQFGLNTFFNNLGGGGTGGLGGLLGRLFKADGGPVDQGSPYIVGERGPELFVPGQSGQVVSNDNMRAAMVRYQRSAGLSNGAGQGGMADDLAADEAAGSAPIDVRYSVERINNVNYVTAAEFERGMTQAAKRGAEMGKRGVYSDLVNKRSIRSRVGI
jgi:tape measure domain-containing protein